MTTRRETPNEFSKEEASVEIEVVPAKPAPRSRRANPTIDNVIHSGEIVEARSRVVRSSNNLPQFVEPPAPAPAPTPTPTPPGPRFVWLVAAIVFGIGAGVLFVFVKPPAPVLADDHTAITAKADAEMIAMALDSEARAAQVRAQAIASSPMLRAGILTDAQTLADMARDKDLQLPVDHGEQLEVFQVRDQVRTSMLRLPANTPALVPPPAGGVRLDARKAGLAVAANAPVDDRNGISGEVVVEIPIELELIKQRVAGMAEASLVGLASPVVLVAATGAPGTQVTVPVTTKLLKPGSLSLSVTATASPAVVASASPLRIARLACVILGALMLVIFAISLRPRAAA